MTLTVIMILMIMMTKRYNYDYGTGDDQDHKNDSYAATDAGSSTSVPCFLFFCCLFFVLLSLSFVLRSGPVLARCPVRSGSGPLSGLVWSSPSPVSGPVGSGQVPICLIWLVETG